MRASEILMRSALVVEVKDDTKYPKARFVSTNMEKVGEVIDADIKPEFVQKMKSIKFTTGDLFVEEFERIGKNGKPWKTYRFVDFCQAVPVAKAV